MVEDGEKLRSAWALAWEQDGEGISGGGRSQKCTCRENRILFHRRGRRATVRGNTFSYPGIGLRPPPRISLGPIFRNAPASVMSRKSCGDLRKPIAFIAKAKHSSAESIPKKITAACDSQRNPHSFGFPSAGEGKHATDPAKLHYPCPTSVSNQAYDGHLILRLEREFHGQLKIAGTSASQVRIAAAYVGCGHLRLVYTAPLGRILTAGGPRTSGTRP